MSTKRNDPCHCGSQNKYKNCCWSKDEAARTVASQEQAAARSEAAKAEAAAAPPSTTKRPVKTTGVAPKAHNQGPAKQNVRRKV